MVIKKKNQRPLSGFRRVTTSLPESTSMLTDESSTPGHSIFYQNRIFVNLKWLFLKTNVVCLLKKKSKTKNGYMLCNWKCCLASTELRAFALKIHFIFIIGYWIKLKYIYTYCLWKWYNYAKQTQNYVYFNLCATKIILMIYKRNKNIT